jgi:transcriptional regulator with XRE-family HTH domain
MADPRRVEFGDFLRSRRERLNPKLLGFASERRRRTAGLRREEVAELAGIGVDWYIRLEQGRTVNPSATTIDALARALRLSRADHAHLKALACQGEPRALPRETVPESILRLLRTLQQPAYVTGRRWDVLAWNAVADDVFGFGRLPEDERNILLCMFADQQARRLFADGWAEEARRMVAQFRATHDVWAGDPGFIALLDRLTQASSEFRRWWRAHEVRNTASGRKTLHHPSKGQMQFEYASFQANDDPALKLVIYTPI